MVQIQNKTYHVNRRFANVVLGVLMTALISSWTFTWRVATDRTEVIETLKSHIDNQYIHNEEHISRHELELYLAPINKGIQRIEKDIQQLKNK